MLLPLLFCFSSSWLAWHYWIDCFSEILSQFYLLNSALLHFLVLGYCHKITLKNNNYCHAKYYLNLHLMLGNIFRLKVVASISKLLALCNFMRRSLAVVWILHENLYDMHKINSFYELDLAAENHFFLYQKIWEIGRKLLTFLFIRFLRNALILWF
jgi:hypothetical protein